MRLDDTSASVARHSTSRTADRTGPCTCHHIYINHIGMLPWQCAEVHMAHALMHLAMAPPAGCMQHSASRSVAARMLSCMGRFCFSLCHERCRLARSIGTHTHACCLPCCRWRTPSKSLGPGRVPMRRVDGQCGWWGCTVLQRACICRIEREALPWRRRMLGQCHAMWARCAGRQRRPHMCVLLAAPHTCYVTWHRLHACD